MPSLDPHALCLWLAAKPACGVECQGYRFEPYQESADLTDAGLLRIRLIYEAPSAQGPLLDWIFTLAKAQGLEVLPVAVIERQVALNCLELTLPQAPSGALLESFPYQLAQLHLIKAPLPRLSTPGLVVMDMDSTAIQIECIDELAAMAGVGEQVAAITERAMQGELDFVQSLRQRVAQLKGADASIIARLCERLPLTPGLLATLKELKSHQWRLVVASGGFTPFAAHLQQQLGLDAAFANELVITDGELAGEVSGTIVDAQFKAD
ncbi:MAG: phosphoserine phosphatase SerB, partial [Shewanella sp.]